MTPLAMTLLLTVAQPQPLVPFDPQPVPQAQPLPQPLPGQPQPFPGQPQPLPAEPQPLLPPQVLPKPVPVVPALPAMPVFKSIPTHKEFAAAFTPHCGKFIVTMLHPRTCKPIEVCFTLPEGCPKVKVTRRKIEYDYGDIEVEIIFRLFGRVTVDYDD